VATSLRGSNAVLTSTSSTSVAGDSVDPDGARRRALLEFEDPVCYVRVNATDTSLEVECTTGFVNSCGKGVCAETYDAAADGGFKHCPAAWMILWNDQDYCFVAWHCCDA
jgi:hypothetical protein